MKIWNTIFAILIIFIGQNSYAAQNLERSDFIGSWVSNWTSVKGEEQSLDITDSLTSVFHRKFEGKVHEQRYTSNQSAAELIDDMLVIKYQNEESVLVYKLVLSGWKSTNAKVLYGTMFMYRNGNQYNGLPVSFNEF